MPETALALLAADGTLLRVDADMCALLGREEEALCGLSWWELVHPEDAGELRAALAELEHGVALSRARARVRVAGGVWQSVAVEAEAVDDDEGTSGAVVLLDTESAEREAEPSPLLTGPAIDGSPAIVWIKDTEGRYLRVNAAYEQALAVTAEEILGRVDRELEPRHCADGARAHERPPDCPPEPLELEYLVSDPRKDDDRWACRFALFDEHGTPWGICGVSVSTLEAAEGRVEVARLLSLERARNHHRELLRHRFLAGDGAGGDIEEDAVIRELVDHVDSTSIAELEAARRRAEQALSDAQRKIDAAEARQARAEAALAAAQAEGPPLDFGATGHHGVAAAEQRAEQAEAQRARAQGALAEIEQRAQAAEADRAQARAELAAVGVRATGAEGQLAQAQAELAVAHARATGAEGQIAHAQAAIEDAGQRVQRASCEVTRAEAATAAAEDRATRAAAARSQAESALAEAEQRAAGATSARVDAESAAAVAAERATSAEAERAQAQAALAGAEAARTQAEEGRAAAEAARGEAEQALAGAERDARAKLEAAGDELEAAIGARRSAEEARAELAASAQAATERAARSERELGALRVERDERAQERDAALLEQRRLAIGVAEQRAHADVANERHRTANAELERLRAAIDAAGAEADVRAAALLEIQRDRDELSTRLAVAEAELAAARERLEATQAERGALERRLGADPELEQDLAAARDERQRALDELATARAKLAATHEEAQRAQAAHERVRGALEQAVAERSELTEQLAGVGRTRDGLADERDELRARAAKLAADAEGMRAAEETLQRDLSAAGERLHERDRELEEARATHAGAEHELATTLARQQELERERDEIQRECEVARDERDAARHERDAARSDAQAREPISADTTSERDAARHELAGALAELAAARAEAGAALDGLAVAQTELAAARAAAAAAAQERDALRGELSVARAWGEERDEAVQAERDEAQAAASAAAERDEAQAAASAAAERDEALRAELSEVQAAATAAAQRDEGLRAELAEAHRAFATTGEERDRLRAELTATQARAGQRDEALQARLASAETVAAAAGEQRDALRDELAAARAAAGGQESLRAAAATARATAEDLATERTALTSELADARAAAYATGAERDRLRRELRATQERVAGLTAELEQARSSAGAPLVGPNRVWSPGGNGDGARGRPLRAATDRAGPAAGSGAGGAVQPAVSAGAGPAGPAAGPSRPWPAPARLEEDVRRRLASAASEHAITRVAIVTAAERLGAAAAVGWRLDTHGRLRCAEMWTLPAPELELLELKTWKSGLDPRAETAGEAWSSLATAWHPDAVSAETCPRARAAAMAGLHALAMVPVIRDGQATGLLEFGFRAAGTPSPELLAALDAVGRTLSEREAEVTSRPGSRWTLRAT